MEISLFDVLGPVMIGPSSSHTAGAAKLGRIAREIVAAPFSHVAFALHGSFGETCRGHGTDKALVAGALGLREDDERLGDAFVLAEQAGLGYSFAKADLGNVHENTVEMTFSLADGAVRVIRGSSLGGGRILITQIDSFSTEITFDAPTVVVFWQDVRGVVSAVSGILATREINIAGMRVNRTAKGKTACAILETDGPVAAEVVAEILALPQVIHAQAVGKGEA